jgi:hypothetical protein
VAAPLLVRAWERWLAWTLLTVFCERRRAFSAALVLFQQDRRPSQTIQLRLMDRSSFRLCDCMMVQFWADGWLAW